LSRFARSSALVAGPQAELVDVRVERGGGKQSAKCLLVLVIGQGAGLVDVLEALTPGGAHDLAVVEALRRITPERLAEELAEAFPEARGEQLGVDRDLAIEMRRIGRPVAPPGERPRGHLVQGDGGGVPLGLKVPPRGLPEGEQRIEIAARPRPDVLGRRAGQGEVEKHDVQLIAPPDHPHGDVVGLDVPVGDALFLEVLDDLQQVLPEPLQVVDLEPPLLPEPLAEGLEPPFGLVDEDGMHQEAVAIADPDFAADLDDVSVTVHGLQDVGLVADPGVLLGVVRRLEHILLTVPGDEERDRARASAEPLDDGEVAGEEVALLGLLRVGDVIVLGRGELVLDQVELLEELGG
jgi:hypothetical protein